MKAAKWIPWLWLPIQTYCCMALMAGVLAWYSNIPEEVLAAQYYFGFHWLVFVFFFALMCGHFALHLVWLIQNELPMWKYWLFLLLPWALAYPAFRFMMQLGYEHVHETMPFIYFQF